MINKSKFTSRISVMVVLCCVIAGTGCKDQKTGTNNGPKAADSASARQVNVRAGGLTLPVLDALFFEDGFQTDLKSKLRLTDQQIQQLKAAANESVADLAEDGTDYLGSARAAARNSEEKIKAILGQEKADQLYQLVTDRYASGDIQGLFPTQPNAIPTDTRIVVNAPAFRMDVFEQGKLLKTYRVGIGYPEFPLPTGMRRAENVIFNPTWTPPDEPWVKGKVQAGKKVAAGSKLNPLGPIKIPIGAPSLIHGGKAATKLGSFASHGCVGMTNEQVEDFAGMLLKLSGTQAAAGSIKDYEKDKTKTKVVKIEKPVLVELRYETIVAENGNLHIYRDVYERGTNTVDNATRILAVYGIKYASLGEEEKQAIVQGLDEMNRDAHGDAIAPGTTDSAKEKEATDGKNKGVADSKIERAQKGKITSVIKGQKDVIIPIAALQGKGYPAPVNMSGLTPGVAER